MSLLRAGQEIDAWCTKCKLDLTHRIIAVADGKPARVECRTCYSTHNYRAPKTGAVALVQRAQKSPAASVASPAAAKPKKPRAEEHVAVVPPPGARVISYRMTERFMKDQWLVHKIFGNGIVLAELADNKIEVRFDDGPRVLVHNRTE
ncbi:MAG: hypothetical protein U0325_08370 [Polyangiales bacterium]